MARLTHSLHHALRLLAYPFTYARTFSWIIQSIVHSFGNPLRRLLILFWDSFESNAVLDDPEFGLNVPGRLISLEHQ